MERQMLCDELERIEAGFVESYEFDDGNGGCYRPTEKERVLIADAIAGLMADEDWLAAFDAWRDAVRGRGID